jgi:hypothetical protein
VTGAGLSAGSPEYFKFDAIYNSEWAAWLQMRRTIDLVARIAGCLLIMAVIGRIQNNGFGDLDDLGWISHETETTITAQQNWFVGESKFCTSTPMELRLATRLSDTHLGTSNVIMALHINSR